MPVLIAISKSTLKVIFGEKSMLTGVIKWFNANKGFGFIEPTDKSKDIFLHISALEKAGIRGINEGQKVGYQIANERGKDAAVDIKLI